MLLSKKKKMGILNYVDSTLDRLYQADKYLFDVKAHERSIVAPFARYFKEFMEDTWFSRYSLDCEYNRDGLDPKRDEAGTLIVPDIIIHKRGDNNGQENICVMEFKTPWDRDNTEDLSKLQGLTSPSGEYQYKIGLSVVFGSRRKDTIIHQVENGIILPLIPYDERTVR